MDSTLLMNLGKDGKPEPPGHTKGTKTMINPLNAELNPIYHLLALLGGATIVVVSRLRVNFYDTLPKIARI
jgi:hypothetical protein